jgi:hypothetical protein
MRTSSHQASAQASLFSLSNMALTVQIPSAPALVPHKWPFPGMTPEDSARAGIANSDEYDDMLAAVIKFQGSAVLTKKQVLALVPDDWRDLCREYTHGSLDFRTGEERGIQVKYVPHDGGGFHFTYQAMEHAA